MLELSKQKDFIPHVHGLRTLAVLSVFLHHLNESLLPGGYIGVDVFFVISGFLITSHICRARAAGRFSYRDFYLRRVRRIIPNQLLIIVLVLALSFAVFDQGQIAEISGSAVYSALLASNVFFLQHSGYFAPAASTMPLLHMWSLAVEEQFYIVWPAAIAALFLLTQKTRRRVITIAFLSLLIATEFTVRAYPDAAFYMMPFRITEFMCGALLALTPGLPTLTTLWRNLACIAGMVLIVCTLVLYTPVTRFPGITALVPCIGTSLIIAFGKGTAIGSVLGSKPGILIGERSYALYLVHWPVIVFLDRLYPLMNTISRFALAVALAFAATEIVFRYWEKPLRYNFSATRFQRSLHLSGVTATAALIVATGAAAKWSGPSTVDMPVRRDESHPSFGYCIDPKAKTVTDCEADILVLGDSHTGHARRALQELTKADGLHVARWSFVGCPPIFGAFKAYDRNPHLQKTRICRDLVGKWEQNAAAIKAPIVVLAARWAWLSEDSAYGAESIQQEAMLRTEGDKMSSAYSRSVLKEQLSYTVDVLRRAGKKVILIGQVPLRSEKAEACLKKYANDPDVETTCQIVPVPDVRERLSFMNGLLSAEARAHPRDVIAYIPLDDFCHESCQLEVNGRPIYRDTNHLNQAGVRYMAGHMDNVLTFIRKSLPLTTNRKIANL